MVLYTCHLQLLRDLGNTITVLYVRNDALTELVVNDSGLSKKFSYEIKQFLIVQPLCY